MESVGLIKEILSGIDKQETDTQDGWWETSVSAKFGAKKLKQVLDVVSELEKEIKVTDDLLADRQRLLDAIPECEVHGKCIPHALEWIEKMKSL